METRLKLSLFAFIMATLLIMISGCKGGFPIEQWEGSIKLPRLPLPIGCCQLSRGCVDGVEGTLCSKGCIDDVVGPACKRGIFYDGQLCSSVTACTGTAKVCLFKGKVYADGAEECREGILYKCDAFTNTFKEQEPCPG